METPSHRNHRIRSHNGERAWRQESVDVFAFGTLMWEAMANDIPFVAWRRDHQHPPGPMQMFIDNGKVLCIELQIDING